MAYADQLAASNNENLNQLQQLASYLSLTPASFGVSSFNDLTRVPHLLPELVAGLGGEGWGAGVDYFTGAFAYPEDGSISDQQYLQNVITKVKDALANPAPWAAQDLANKAWTYGYNLRNFPGQYDADSLEALQNATKKASEFGVPSSQIQNSVTQSYSEGYGRSNVASYGGGGSFGFGDLGPFAAIAAAYFLPGVGEAIATQLGVSSATGTALASVALQTAQGVPLEQAVQNAAINTVVQTGATNVATEMNTVLQDPKLTNTLTSVGASMVATAVKGGSEQDVINSATGALIGSGVTQETGSAAAGGAASVLAQGGTPTQAAIAAAGAQGRSDIMPSTPVTTSVSQAIEPSRDYVQEAENLLKQYEVAGYALPVEAPTPGISVANSGPLVRLVQDAANDPAFVKALPSLEKSLASYGLSIARVLNTAISLGTYTPSLNPNEDIALRQKLESAGIPYAPDYTNRPLSELPSKEISGEPVTEVNVPSEEPKTTEITPPDITIAPTVTPTPSPAPSTSPVAPPFSVPIDAPAPITTPAPIVTPAPAPQEITIPEQITQPFPEVEPRPQQQLEPAPTLPGREQQIIDLITQPTIPDGMNQSETMVTPKAGEVTPTLPEVPVTPESLTESSADLSSKPSKEESEKEEAKKEEKYKPELFITGGILPIMSQRSSLGQVLGVDTTPLSTTGLTSYRGAGEIESPETGGKRRNVWNEASLRLKDALGL